MATDLALLDDVVRDVFSAVEQRHMWDSYQYTDRPSKTYLEGLRVTIVTRYRLRMAARRRMAERMGYHPHIPESWPGKTLDSLIKLQREHGEAKLAFAIVALTRGPRS